MAIEISYSSGRAKTFPTGTTLEEIVQDSEFPQGGGLLMGVRVGNQVRSLSERLVVDAQVEPVCAHSRDGHTAYRRSLCFLLAAAATGLFPERRLIIGHSLGPAFFYSFDGLEKVKETDLDALRSAMADLVVRDLPIRCENLSYVRALEHFRTHTQPDTALLLSHSNEPHITVNVCDGYLDLYHGPLAPRTGVLGIFELLSYPPGFLLRYAPPDDPLELAEFQDHPVLSSIYREYKDWGKILQVPSVGHLNGLTETGKIHDFIQVAEALHDKKIAQTADRIAARRQDIRLILVAGPSSSGKTTFSKKLAIQLRVVGRNPVLVSLDDYFVPRELTPRDENGEFDYESLDAVDVELLNDHLLRLFRGTQIELPRYDFRQGVRRHGSRLAMDDRSVIVLEGIHGLNEGLTPLVPADRKYRIYVSALTQLNLDDHNRISTTDNRLIRRIVRDNRYRGHDCLTTLGMWDSVLRGENRNIFPYQDSADSAFNSALDYELPVLKVYADPLLRSVKPDVPEYGEAKRLLSFLANFGPIPPTWVPDASILREFIGESVFKY